jgi:hypothetical protein
MLCKTLLAAVTISLIGSSALAQDGPPAAAAAADEAPTLINNADQDAARANSEWVRRVLAGESTDDAKTKTAAKDCDRNLDNKAHGVVWGSVGSGGYKSGGAIITQPVGDCSSITVGYEQTHDNSDYYRGDRLDQYGPFGRNPGRP